MRIEPDYRKFLKLSKEGNLIPVYMELLSDIYTPFILLQKLGDSPYVFLLESITGGEHIARYSFVGSKPISIIKTRGRRALLVERGREKEVEFSKDPLEVIQGQLEKYKYVKLEGLPRFSGGYVGYMSYDLIRFFERIPDENPDDLNLYDLFFMECRDIYIFDHIKQRLILLTHVDVKEEGVRDGYKRAGQRLEGMLKVVQTKIRASNPRIVSDGYKSKAGIKSNFKEGEFLRIVRKAKEYIRAGDIIQVVLSQRFERRTKVPDKEIYRWLRFINPSPYMFYINCGDHCLIGSSPEVFVRCESRRAELRPIAGTRRRGRNQEEDHSLEGELLNDAKERAEHIMLVDLGRNDLGRVCKYGSVCVKEFMVIERYSHVMHIVSDVVGELREDRDVFDLIRATFPAGTVSGAPKIRAMEIIDELENIRRGPYAGCVGYFSYSGNLDSCITIRTIVKKGEKVYIQAGAGIVADSVPEREYMETINKAKALNKAVDLAEVSL